MTAGDVADAYQDSTLESQSEDESDDDDHYEGSEYGFRRRGDEVSMNKNMYFAALEVRKLLTERCKFGVAT